MPFDGTDQGGFGLIYPYHCYPNAPVTPHAFFTAMKTSIALSRMKVPVCYHTFWPGLQHIDATSYGTTGTIDRELFRIRFAVPDHVTHISYEGKAGINVYNIDTEDFQYHAECVAGGTPDEQAEVTVGVEAHDPLSSRLEALGGGVRFFYDKTRAVTISGTVELSNVSPPTDLWFILYGNCGNSTTVMSLVDTLIVYWESKG